MARVWVSVVTLAALLGGTFGADTVTQTEGSVGISQGDPLRVNCTYKFSVTPNNLFWYVQYPGQAPRLLLQHLVRLDSDEGIRKGFNATHDTKEKSFHLWKASVELSDSATYYCAGSERGVKLTFGSGTQLTVVPKLDNSPPSIYPLTSDNKNLLACLVTDFFPGNISVGSRPNAKLTSLNASLVVMKGSGEASYGTVLWGPRDELACTADHDNQNFQLTDFDEEDDTCMIVEMDENFETDKNLNFLSLTLLGLRIVFVKTVAINLLLTLSQWKR